MTSPCPHCGSRAAVVSGLCANCGVLRDRGFVPAPRYDRGGGSYRSWGVGFGLSVILVACATVVAAWFALEAAVVLGVLVLLAVLLRSMLR